MTHYKKHDFIYTANFCEENIWHLCQRLVTAGMDAASIDILMLSNERRQIPLMHQQAGIADNPVIWDYHVILLAQRELRQWLFDFDSRLSFPCAVDEYFRLTLSYSWQLASCQQVTIRQIPATQYMARFASDRSHMIDGRGVAMSPFPDYAPIYPKHQAIHLYDYLNFRQPIEDTIIVSSNEFLDVN